MVYPIFENILKFPSVDLSAFLHHSLKEILSYLKITTLIVPTSVVYPKNDLKGQYRILDICQREGATIYLNPPGGKELYECELFHAAGINLYFLEPDLQGMNLVSGINQGTVLSILDLMMLNHPNLIRQNLACYQLV
jgi:hypothetical protein